MEDREAYIGIEQELSAHTDTGPTRMLRRALPYFPAENQKTMTVLLKAMELGNTIQYMNSSQKEPLFQPQEIGSHIKMTELIAMLKEYLSPAEQKNIDQMFSCLQLLQLVSDFGQMDAESMESMLAKFV